MTIPEYFPFLKLKQNEIRAISDLADFSLDKIHPVFDMPRESDMDADGLKTKLLSAYTEMGRRWREGKHFYLDVFDINPLLKPNGLHPYEYVLNAFRKLKPYPVVGLDRDEEHNLAALNYIDSVGNDVNRVGVRLLQRDFEFYSLSVEDLRKLLAPFVERDISIDIFLDCRNVFNKNINEIETQLLNFLPLLSNDFLISKIVITSCSIPKFITDAVATGGSARIDRMEANLFESLNKQYPNVIYGDYSTISPEYHDVPAQILSRVSAPKIIYTSKDSYFIVRGNLFRTHPDGFRQYYDLAEKVVLQKEFRSNFSQGDVYIEDRSKRVGSTGNPSSWIRATVNSHLTFITN